MIKEMWRCRDKESLVGQETSNNLDHKPATQQSHQNLSSLKDIDKGLTHITMLFLEEADPHQMKTAGCQHVSPRPVETRRLEMLET